MTIALSRAEIDAALPKLKGALSKYLWLQRQRDHVDVRQDRTFQRKFNHFYRVRRGVVWQSHFYQLLEEKKRFKVTYLEILETLHKATNRYEASFSSKLAATIDPTLPVIDSIVLRNLGLRLPSQGVENRLLLIDKLYACLRSQFADFLKTESGKYLIAEFSIAYPDPGITPVKMIDLVLWQTRPGPLS